MLSDWILIWAVKNISVTSLRAHRLIDSLTISLLKCRGSNSLKWSRRPPRAESADKEKPCVDVQSTAFVLQRRRPFKTHALRLC